MKEPVFSLKSLLTIIGLIITLGGIAVASTTSSNNYTDKQVKEAKQDVKEDINELKQNLKELRNEQKKQGESLVRIEEILKRKL